MKKILLCSSGILLLIFVSVNAQADFVQLPWPDPHGALQSGDYPVTYGGGTGQVFDNFTLQSAGGITAITWWGYYTPSANITPAFTLTLYDKSASYLDGSGYSISGPDTGSAIPISYSSLNYGKFGTPDANTGIYQYQYTATLTTPFDATVNTLYWLSVFNTAPATLWGWQPQDDPDGIYLNGAFQNDTYFGNSTVSNVAFEITQNAVPIPPAAWLLASGLIGLVLIRRRGRMR